MVRITNKKRFITFITSLMVVVIVFTVFVAMTIFNQTAEAMETAHAETIAIIKEHNRPAILVTSEPETKPERTLKLNSEERDLIERIVAAEARGESIEGMMGVAQTIRDRSLEWEEAITDIATAPYQFAEPYAGEVSQKVKDAVRFVFDEGQEVLDYPTTHFYAWQMIEPPDWTYSKECRGTIGGARFYY